MKMVLIFCKMSTGFYGEGATEVFTGKLPIDQPYNNEYAQAIAEQNAETYSSNGCEVCYDCGAEANDSPCECGSDHTTWQENENIDFSLEVYCPDNHDQLRSGGGSFLSEFPDAVLENDAYYIDE